MLTELVVIVAVSIYKISCLTVGSLFCVLGYHLFKSGAWGCAGDINTQFGNNSIVLKSAAPGTFFTTLVIL